MILFWILGLYSHLAFSKETDFEVVSLDCEFYKLERKGTPKLIDDVGKMPPLHSHILGERYKKKKGFVRFYKGRSSYLIEERCLEGPASRPKEKAEPPKPVSPEVPAPEAPRAEGKKPSGDSKPPLAVNKQISVSVSLISWQDRFSLGGGGQTYPLISTTLGVCPGGGWQREIKGNWSFDLPGCFIIASSDVGSPTGKAPPDLSYSIKNAHVYGVHTVPGILWKPEEGSVQVGLGLSLLYRTGSWVEPGNGYALDTGSAISFGPMLSARFDLDPVYFSPKVGFYHSNANYLWLLELAYRVSMARYSAP